MDKIEIKTIILTFLVWFISGFDLILLTLLSVEIQKSFFPHTDQTVSILAVYGTLSLSLLGRVFGGLYFSRIADEYGRKPVVLLCLFILSITMILSPYIPSIYQNFTPLSNTVVPLLFVLSRIVIGFFVGGIWPTAAILGLEIISKSKLDYKIGPKWLNNYQSFTAIRNYEEGTIFNLKKILSNPQLLKYVRNFNQNIDILKRYEHYFNKEARKLTGKSASMQIGFFTGYLIAAGLYYTDVNKFFYNLIQHKLVSLFGSWPSLLSYHAIQFLCEIKIIFPDYDNFGAFGSMSLFIGILGLIVFVFYRILIPESDYWNMWKYLYRKPNMMLAEQYKLLKEDEKNGNIDKIKLIKENIKLIKNNNQNEKLKPGINKLLNNSECREKIIGFWLIMSGLMYMYYSTVVVVPEILSRDNILIRSNPIDQIPQLHQISDIILAHLNLIDNTPRVVTLIILTTALVAHGMLGIALYRSWQNGRGNREKIIFYLFEDSERVSKWFRNRIVKAFGIFNYKDTNANKEKHDKDSITQLNLDLEIIKGIGYLLIIIGIINSIIFFIWLKDRSIHQTLLVALTALATLVANSGWAIVPSMLASRFPTHFRATGSSLAYNGGLAISFASPFIIMEFYLSIKSEYIIFIAMILGAISMIIGAKRLIHHEKM
jgi:MFS family permease